MNREELKQRLIELLKEADKRCDDTEQCKNCVGFGHGKECINYLITTHLLSNGVTIRERGEWQWREFWGKGGTWRCSKCGRQIMFQNGTPKTERMYLCPECGAEMKSMTEPTRDIKADMRGVKDD